MSNFFNKSEKKNKNVFILGAGFSKALNSDIPVLYELSQIINSQMNSDQKYFSKPLISHFESINQDLKNNIEHLLSYLITDLPWKGESTKKLDEALYIEISKRIKDILEKYEVTITTADRKGNIKKLFDFFYNFQSRVLSLNYDLNFEKLFCEYERAQQLPAGGRHIGYQDLYRMPLECRGGNLADLGAGYSSYSRCHLIKLHGSINWFYSGTKSFPNEQIYYCQTENNLSHYEDLVPFIIPPVFDKGSLYAHKVLQNLWRKGAQYIGEANTLFVIGYSLPITDLSFEFFLRQNLKSSTRIVVVNPDSSAEFMIRYKKFFGEEISLYQNLDNFIEKEIT